MQFLLITRYRHGPGPVYERAAATGRHLPDDVTFLGSWIVDDEALDTCYEVVEAPSRAALDPWLAHWEDLIEAEVLPVIGSAEAAERSGVAWGG